MSEDKKPNPVTEEPPNYPVYEGPMFILPMIRVSRAEFLKLYPRDAKESSEESAEGP